MNPNTSIMVAPSIGEDALLKLVTTGDLSVLSPADKTRYYVGFCQRLGLDPATQPLKILKLNGKEKLYADRECCQQLNRLHGVSHEVRSREVVTGCYVVTARASAGGRYTDSIGAVPVEGLKGEALSNAMMKSETKAKRRSTLDLIGLGLLDETEVATIPGAVTLPPPVASLPQGSLAQLPIASTAGFDAPDESEHPPEAPKAPVAVKPPTQKEKADAFVKLLQSCKSRFISQVKPVEHAALEYFRGLETLGIMPNEGLEDIPASSLFPHADVEASAEENHDAIKADRDHHMAKIMAIVNDNNQLEGAEIEVPSVPEIAASVEPVVKPPPPGTESRRINVKGVSAKSGTSARGPWLRTGVVDAEGTWYNTFDRTAGEKAKALKGMDATIWFVAGEKGNNFSDIEPV